MAHNWRQTKKELGPGYYEYQSSCTECGFLTGRICTSRLIPVSKTDEPVFVVWKDALGQIQSEYMTCDEYKVHSGWS